MAAMQRESADFFRRHPIEFAIADRALPRGGVYQHPGGKTRCDAVSRLPTRRKLPAIHDTNGVKQDAAGKPFPTSRARTACAGRTAARPLIS